MRRRTGEATKLRPRFRIGIGAIIDSLAGSSPTTPAAASCGTTARNVGVVATMVRR
jgi:hypothetical protein